ncbi:MAG: protein kinase domain-containing protein [Pirellulaceae bacterium]
MTRPPLTEEDIFQVARRIEFIEARAAYLEQVCGDDAALREQVESLLGAYDDSRSFLEASPGAVMAADLAATSTINQLVAEPVSAQVGPYRLLQQIGEGGMGVVYMAEQTQPVQRRIALKIIKPGMDSRQVIARFEAERQALALMDHPNIAKVLDAGTTDLGRPYFVMELVKGVPITRYCDEQHLTPRQRLELFMSVCQAVQHAHQKGIIHRDIKPSNILVAEYDDRPVPKVIDFGVAKAVEQRLTQKTMFTDLGQVVGTIEYMSPEQAKFNQLDIDTRSDIYSLGVVLYELLTGETPMDRQRLRNAGFDEMLRIIREEEPPRPSIRLSSSHSLPSIAAQRQTEPRKLSTLVRGELDWIVMKALDKDRARRYQTATGLAADIDRYLTDEPVLACPPSTAYRFHKFARRNKAAVVTSGMVVTALILGMAGTVWQAARATLAEHLAKENERRATEQARISESVTTFLTNDLLAKADVRQQFQVDAAPDPNIKVRTLLDRAARSLDSRFFAHPTVEAAVRYTLGTTYRELGLFREAETHLKRSAQIREEQLGSTHADTVGAKAALATLYANTDDRRGEAALLEILATQERVFGKQHATTLVTMHRLGSLYARHGEFDKAESYHLPALATQRRELGEDHPDTIDGMVDTAQLWIYRKNFAPAEQLLRRAIQLREATYGSRHPATAEAMFSLASLFQIATRYQEAERQYRQLLEIGRAVFGSQDPLVMVTMHNLAWVCWFQQRRDEAVAILQDALVLAPSALGKESPVTLAIRNSLALFFESQERHFDAYLQRVAQLRAIQLAKADPDAFAATSASSYFTRHANEDYCRGELNRCLERLPSELIALANTSPALARQRASRCVSDLEDNPLALRTLGIVEYHCRNWSAADEVLRAFHQQSSTRDAVVEFFLAMTCWQLGEEDGARKWHAEAAAWMDANDPKNDELIRLRAESETKLNTAQSRSSPPADTSQSKQDPGFKASHPD